MYEIGIHGGKGLTCAASTRRCSVYEHAQGMRAQAGWHAGHATISLYFTRSAL